MFSFITGCTTALRVVLSRSLHNKGVNFGSRILFAIRQLRKPFGLLDYSASPPIRLSLQSRSDAMRLDSCRKEPETISWLERYCTADAILYDIGANVGAYTLVAAHLGARVVSFEPSPLSYAALCENILFNKKSSKVTPLCLALGSKNGIMPIMFSSIESGAAQHSLGDAASAGVESLDIPVLSLDMVRESLDLPAPTLLKIDVDGGEFELIQGAHNMLSYPKLSSVLIEIDFHSENGNRIVQRMEAYGFVLHEKHPRGKGASKTLFNCIFVRE